MVKKTIKLPPITREQNEAMNNEHDAWIAMFTVMKKLLGFTSKQLNDMQYREIFEQIERWGYFDYLRRKKFPITGESATGIFWNGE